MNPLTGDYLSALRSSEPNRLEIFISHSSKDVVVAEALTDFLRAAINVSHEHIRCTSLPGYSLPGGVSTDEQIKNEVRDSLCFIGLLTPHSLRSPYVLFELGARWGAQLPFIPLLASGSIASDLTSPLSSLNALSCSSPPQLHQLVSQIASTLRKIPSSPAAYERHLQKLVDVAKPHVGTTVPSATETTQTHIPEPKPFSQPETQAGQELLALIQAETDPQTRGLVEIIKEIQPGVTHFFPKIQYAGSTMSAKTRLFREGVAELIARGWLFPPERNESTNTRTYEYRNVPT